MVGVRALRWVGGSQGPGVGLLDQTVLPLTEREVVCRDVPALVDAIQRLVVRGAPLLGVAGAYGVALAARIAEEAEGAGGRDSASGEGAGGGDRASGGSAGGRDSASGGSAGGGDRASGEGGAGGGDRVSGGGVESVRRDAGLLARARPTAVNLARGVERAYRGFLRGGAAGALREADALAEEDALACDQMAGRGLAFVPDGARILTHCNTGGLVTMGIGTAFGVVLAAHRAGRLARLWVDETRPLLQGARLTAYEAARNGMPYSVLADGAAASLFAAGQVDLVVVGADRIAADGSVANKVGTYALAVLAHHHGVPFVVVAPSSTVDLDTPDGSRIIVEQREAAEVTGFNGTPTAPEGSVAYNPAFDVTPPQLIFALVSERGVAQPVNAERVARLRPSLPARRDDDEAQ